MRFLVGRVPNGTATATCVIVLLHFLSYLDFGLGSNVNRKDSEIDIVQSLFRLERTRRSNECVLREKVIHGENVGPRRMTRERHLRVWLAKFPG